jgi:hypothetical protein
MVGGYFAYACFNFKHPERKREDNPRDCSHKYFEMMQSNIMFNGHQIIHSYVNHYIILEGIKINF